MPPQKAQPSFRSGAVATMAGMPVATLRIWEQRYQAVRPTTASSGHRLYSAADVERVSLLRRLTQQGHAIGLLAALDTDHMRAMLHAPAAANAGKSSELPRRPTAIRVVVVGQAFARRLQRWSDRQPSGPTLLWIGIFDSLAEAAQAAQDSSAPEVDVLIWQAPSVHPGASPEMRAAQRAWRAHSAAVVYRYSSAAGRTELADAGAAVFLEPADDEALGPWLAALKRSETQSGQDSRAHDTSDSVGMDLANYLVSTPRFADLALTEFAGLSSAIACECPSHLAQLLLQISNFETYSSECAHRSPDDAQLHTYLQRTAGAARMLFEAALEHVAIAEGLPLPDRIHVMPLVATGGARPAPASSSI
jgi:MerR family transcriptional regulator, light-induced transcriptional regulator